MYAGSIPFLMNFLLYDIFLPFEKKSDVDRRIQESIQLITTYGGIVPTIITQKRHHSSSTSFIGKGKLLQICDLLKEKGDFSVLLVNSDLKSKQIYVLEKFIQEQEVKKVQIWDRVDLILNIFSKHAKTMEAKLQLEMAKIKHMGPRIYGMGIELSRQSGGIGTRGIGETNTEIMRRHLKEHLRRVENRLKKLEHTRTLHRKFREKKSFYKVSLIGYTNAGKSTIFKALTKKEVLIQQALFATLDTSRGKIFIENDATEFLVTDTIGFIQNLPPELIAAFRSTLEESLEADLLLHVIDVTDPHAWKKVEEVEKILDQLSLGHIKTLYIYNKIDIKCDNAHWPWICNIQAIPVSGSTHYGIDVLKKQISICHANKHT